MPRTPRLIVLALSLLLAVSLLAGVAMRRSRDDGDAPYKQMGVMTEVYQYINEDYVTEPSLPKVTDGALHGLAESLDADSSYLNKDEYQAFLAAEKQSPQGETGALLAKRAGYAVVVDVRAGSPAEQAGLMRGDFVEAIGDAGTRDLSITEIEQRLLGAPGSSVTASVVHLHRSDPVKITIQRAKLGLQPLTTSVQAGVGVIQVPDFDNGRTQQVAAAVKTLEKGGATKFVLDLRDCGAGTYQEAEQTANLFLNHGTITYLEGQKYPRETISADAAKALAAQQPLEVLVNAGTSGPAEVAAAALGQNQRGDLIGDKTFGEGSVQKLIEVGDGSALWLSVARYYSPQGKPIEDGLTPSVAQVQFSGALPDEDYAPEGSSGPQPDLQMQKAMQMLSAKSN